MVHSCKLPVGKLTFLLFYAIMSNTHTDVQRYSTSCARNAHFSLTSWYINYIVACSHKVHVDFYVDQINSSVGIVLSVGSFSHFAQWGRHSFESFCQSAKAF